MVEPPKERHEKKKHGDDASEYDVTFVRALQYWRQRNGSLMGMEKLMETVNTYTSSLAEIATNTEASNKNA